MIFLGIISLCIASYTCMLFMYTLILYLCLSAIQASLPVAKLCALVTMQGPREADGGSRIQDFALPLKLVADSKVCK